MRLKNTDEVKMLDMYISLQEKEKQEGTEITIKYDELWEHKDNWKGMGIIYTLLTNWKSNKDYGVVEFNSYNGLNVLTIFVRGDETRAKDLMEYINCELRTVDIPEFKITDLKPATIIMVDACYDETDYSKMPSEDDNLYKNARLFIKYEDL